MANNPYTHIIYIQTVFHLSLVEAPIAHTHHHPHTHTHTPPSVMNKFTAHYSGLDLWQNNAGTNNLVCQHLSAASSITVTALNLNSKVHLTAGPFSDYPPWLVPIAADRVGLL